MPQQSDRVGDKHEPFRRQVATSAISAGDVDAVAMISRETRSSPRAAAAGPATVVDRRHGVEKVGGVACSGASKASFAVA